MFHKRHPKIGARPGTLVIHEQSPPPRIRVVEYNAEGVQERDITDPQELRSLPKDGHIAWIDVQGFGDEATIRAIGDIFKLHPLVLEDVVNVPQRPKAEPYEDYLLLLSRMVQFHENTTQREQVAIILGKGYVLTFQEKYGDVFNPVRERLRQGKGPIRRSGPDYLAYAILDAMIDAYYPVLESFGDALEELEDSIVAAPTADSLHDIHGIKRELLAVRRAVWPTREAVNSLIRDDAPFITDNVRVYLRDCYDHCVQIIDIVETYRELSGGLMDVYLSAVSMRQNEVMKVLTVMASIFIPLTFIAGLYGMNFEYMPELHYRWAYPFLLAMMGILAVLMVWFFRYKGWLGPTRDRDE